jgi:hypothetical protein
MGEFRPFDRALKDDELLTQHGVLDKEVDFGARQIGEGADREGNIGWFGPGFDRFFDAVKQTFASIPDLRKHDNFNSIFCKFRLEWNGS